MVMWKFFRCTTLGKKRPFTASKKTRAERKAGPLQERQSLFHFIDFARKKADVMNYSLTCVPTPLQMPRIHGQENKTFQNQAELG